MEQGFDPSQGNYSLFSLKIHDQPILSAHFRKAEVSRIIIVGFGYEYSVLHTALDACQLNPREHSSVIVVADACCPCEFVMGMDQVADAELLSEGVHIMSSYEIPSIEDAVPISDEDFDATTSAMQWRTELHRLAADRSRMGTKTLKQLAQGVQSSHMSTGRARIPNPFALDWFGNSALIVAASHRNTVAINVILVLLLSLIHI